MASPAQALYNNQDEPARAGDRAPGVLDLLFGTPEPPVLESASHVAADAARLRDLFRRETGGHQVPERFDHAAARLYWGASAPPLLASQRNTIQKLMHRRKLLVSTPLVTSWEEQDPHYGRWVLATLCYGEYGNFRIVNNNHPRLNNPPLSLPPRQVWVNLCWGAGFASAPQAGALQGCMALLLDDFRSVLRRLPVGFHLHRLSPLPSSTLTVMPGPRWRKLDVAAASFPPGRIVACLFRRTNYADLAATQAWAIDKPTSGQRSWKIAFLMERDFPALGFVPVQGSQLMANLSSWYSPHAGVLQGMEHIALIPAEPGPGVIFKANPVAGGLRLDPIRLRHAEYPDTDYWRMRMNLLDVLLEVLWEKTAR